MARPLVTITIPTFNSEKYLPLCLESIKKQTYKNIEISIIDGYSRDCTVEIAKEFGVKEIHTYKGGLLGARGEGVKRARGEYILLLDSDQVLEVDTVERCVNCLRYHDLDMVVLEEDVYYCGTFTEKLFHLDRKLVHAVKEMDPVTSVLIPRFFKAELLHTVFSNFPAEVIKNTISQDHAILHLECWRKTQKVDMLSDAVKHIEPHNLKILIKKSFRWGYYSDNSTSPEYDEYFKKKTERFRGGLFRPGLFKESVGSIVLLILKGIPYKCGYIMSKLRIRHD